MLSSSESDRQCFRRGSRGSRFAFLPFQTLAIAFGLAFAVLALLLFAAGLLLALRFAQQAQVMFGVLLKVLSRHAIIGQLRIARQLIVFVDDLLRGAAHLALGARAVKDPVHHISG